MVFEQRMRERAMTSDGLRRAKLLKDAVLEVLLDSRVLPRPQGTTVRGKLAQLIENLSKKGKIVESFLLELVSVAVSSNIALELEVRFRRATGRDKFWKVFRIRGLP